MLSSWPAWVRRRISSSAISLRSARIAASCARRWGSMPAPRSRSASFSRRRFWKAGDRAGADLFHPRHQAADVAAALPHLLRRWPRLRARGTRFSIATASRRRFQQRLGRPLRRVPLHRPCRDMPGMRSAAVQIRLRRRCRRVCAASRKASMYAWNIARFSGAALPSDVPREARRGSARGRAPPRS